MVQVRPAEIKDCDDIFNWRNDNHTRNMSNNNGCLDFDEHKRWYRSSLNYPQRLILICEDYKNKNKIGMVRFDLIESKALISINLRPESRGKGYAKKCLKKSIEFFVKYFPDCEFIEAKVKKINEASKNTFKGVGFYLSKSDKDNIYYELFCKNLNLF